MLIPLRPDSPSKELFDSCITWKMYNTPRPLPLPPVRACALYPLSRLPDTWTNYRPPHLAKILLKVLSGLNNVLPIAVLRCQEDHGPSQLQCQALSLIIPRTRNLLPMLLDNWHARQPFSTSTRLVINRTLQHDSIKY